MQNILSFEIEGTKYVSKPFDFEAMCIINEAQNNNEKNGPLRMCTDAVDYLFEGTEATVDVLAQMPIEQRTQMCLDLWKWYIEKLTAMAGTRKNGKSQAK